MTKCSPGSFSKKKTIDTAPEKKVGRTLRLCSSLAPAKPDRNAVLEERWLMTDEIGLVVYDDFLLARDTRPCCEADKEGHEL